MMVIVRALAEVDTRAARWWWLLLGRMLVLGGAHRAQAADVLERLKNQEIKPALRLQVGHSKALRPPFAISPISMADPEIADLILNADKEIYVNARSPGMTNLSTRGQSRVNPATVTGKADVILLQGKLHQVLPQEKIGVEAAEDSVALSGEVTGPVAQKTAASLVPPLGFGPQAVK
jgi:Flp pilus assembly secretin CpaC